MTWKPFRIIPVGRTSDPNPENYSHGVFMRFQRKEDLAKFYENALYMRVLKEHVAPYCHVCATM